MIKIASRVVNPKRHTIGYMVKNDRTVKTRVFYTVSQLSRLAKQGKVSGVRAVGNHIQSVLGRRRLSDLPTVVEYKD